MVLNVDPVVTDVAVKSTVPGAHTAAGFVIVTVGNAFTVIEAVPVKLVAVHFESTSDEIE